MSSLFVRSLLMPALAAAALLSATAVPGSAQITSAAQEGHAWTVHDRERPNPAVVTPGATPANAPSDAKILFDGHDLSAFESVRGGAAPWKVEGGFFAVEPGTGSIRTKDAFGDCQIHLEWASPNPPKGEDQGRGNSGVIVMGMYEIQVLDSYNAKTYADGQAGAVYGQYPPLVNAAKVPGEWQTYDVIFRGPRFDSEGRLIRRTRVTLIHNGVVVQDGSELSGSTAYHNRPPYFPVPERLPLVLQEHGTAVHYRNIWIRDLAEAAEPLPVTSFVPLHSTAVQNADFLGAYQAAEATLLVTNQGERLHAEITNTKSNGPGTPLDLIPRSDDAFVGRGLPGNDALPMFFTRQGGKVTTLTVFLGGHYVSFGKK